MVVHVERDQVHLEVQLLGRDAVDLPVERESALRRIVPLPFIVQDDLLERGAVILRLEPQDRRESLISFSQVRLIFYLYGKRFMGENLDRNLYKIKIRVNIGPLSGIPANQ